MIQPEDFIERLKKMMTYYNLSASAFADKVGVQRSSISHILSGRNKPSLEFVMKLLSHFPEVNLYWLLNGKGHFPDKEVVVENTNSKTKNKSEPLIETLTNNYTESEIDRIIIFYNDGTFKNFKNKA